MRADDEDTRQAAIVEYVRTVAPHILIWAVPNGGLRTKREAALLKLTGVLAGVPDLTLAYAFGKSVFWETKTPRGRLSKAQKEVHERLRELGHYVAIVWDIDDARSELRFLGISTKEAK